MPNQPVSRRTLLIAAAAGVPVLFAASRRRAGAGAVAADAAPAEATLAPTPACGDGPTPEQIEGPFFTPQSPQRDDFSADGAVGRAMILAGSVVSVACQPVAGALVDLWQADGAGAYDNEGFHLRGHVFTDSAGSYRFRTVAPGLYPGRTRHFHVKVQPPGGPVLTTQLYFPGEPANSADGFYQPELEMDVRDGDPIEGAFTFVVET